MIRERARSPVLWLLALAAPAVACILSDGPPVIVVPAPSRPVIVNAATVPELAKIIDDPRALKFAVPVEVDYDQRLKYLVLVDFDERNPNVPQPSSLNPVSENQPRRTIEFDLSKGDLDPDQCHDIVLVVALEFDDTRYAPAKPPGGDKATWFYRPRGVSCEAYDAGPLPEAGADASDAAVDGGTE